MYYEKDGQDALKSFQNVATNILDEKDNYVTVDNFIASDSTVFYRKMLDTGHITTVWKMSILS